MRLDVYLSSLLSVSREKARRMILDGDVTVDKICVQKPAHEVVGKPVIEVKPAVRYVGRGGHKLEAAFERFGISLEGETCLDVGASTGGFTDCMLKRGASKVYAVENGNGQLDTSLFADRRVVSLENTDIRDESLLKRLSPAGFSSVDVSFISLKQVLPYVSRLTRPSGDIVCLVKPQFEAGREHIGKNGIVKDPKVHVRVLNEITEYVKQINLSPVNLTFSPIKGGSGNIEYLLRIKNCPGEAEPLIGAGETVSEAFYFFRKD